MPNFLRKNSSIKIEKCYCYGQASLNSRFLLDLSFNNGVSKETIAVVIMMNPSSTARENIFYHVPLSKINDVDETTRNVIEKLADVGINYDKGINTVPPNRFNRIILLNLFPYYSSQPHELKKIYQDTSNSSYYLNINTIDEVMKNYPNAVYFCGWIKRNSLSFAEKDINRMMIKNKINNTFCFDSSKGLFVKYNPSLTALQIMTHASKWK